MKGRVSSISICSILGEHRRELPPELVGALVALGGRFAEGLQDDRLERRLEPRREGAGRLRFLAQVALADLERVGVPGAEGHDPGHHAVEQHAARVDVGARVDRAPHALLRRHVLGRADEGPRPRLLAEAEAVLEPTLPPADALGDAEVEQLDALAEALPARDDHDVLGLDVAVHDAALVRHRERAAELHEDAVARASGMQGVAARRAPRLWPWRSSMTR